MYSESKYARDNPQQSRCLKNWLSIRIVEYQSNYLEVIFDCKSISTIE